MGEFFSRSRLVNLYTLRFAIVAALTMFASSIPAPIAESLGRVVASIDGGDKGALVLATFGGVMALLDIVRKSKTPATPAGVLTPGDAKR